MNLSTTTARRASAQWAGLALLLVGFTNCSTAASPSPSPKIIIDDATCEAGLKPVVTIDSNTFGNGYTPSVSGLAAGDDGTVYVEIDAISPPGAIYAIAPGTNVLTPISSPIADFDAGRRDRLWVDGKTLVIASLGKLFTMPTSGGTPTLVAQIPPTTGSSPQPLVGLSYALDADSLYVGVVYDPYSSAFSAQIVRLPRAGGSPTVVFSSNDQASYWSLYQANLQTDDSNVYFVSASGDLTRVPKDGSTPTVIRGGVGAPPSVLLRVGADFYDQPWLSTITRYPSDGRLAPQPIGGIDDMDTATAAVADNQAAYVALASSQGASSRVIVAPLPSDDEEVTAMGCTGLVSAWQFAAALTLNQTSVFALIGTPGKQWTIFRGDR
jgi:hypothetical protein